MYLLILLEYRKMHPRNWWPSREARATCTMLNNSLLRLGLYLQFPEIARTGSLRCNSLQSQDVDTVGNAFFSEWVKKVQTTTSWIPPRAIQIKSGRSCLASPQRRRSQHWRHVPCVANASKLQPTAKHCFFFSVVQKTGTGEDILQSAPSESLSFSARPRRRLWWMMRTLRLDWFWSSLWKDGRARRPLQWDELRQRTRWLVPAECTGGTPVEVRISSQRERRCLKTSIQVAGVGVVSS